MLWFNVLLAGIAAFLWIGAFAWYWIGSHRIKMFIGRQKRRLGFAPKKTQG